MELDLNKTEICDDGSESGVRKIIDHSLVDDQCVGVYFRNLKEHLIECIRDADCVFGCVAWLTDFDILNELAKKRGVSIVVNKEDFLRPDCAPDGTLARWKKSSLGDELRQKYSALSCTERTDFQGFVRELCVCGDPKIEPVRCVGVITNGESGPFNPRMHHKFAVFAKVDPEGIEKRRRRWEERELRGAPPPLWLAPYRVWTGSFNWTHTARRSLENAVVITDETVAGVYYREFQEVLALSESLDWCSEYVAPEWRIGT